MRSVSGTIAAKVAMPCLFMAVSACGGGSGNVASTPTPTPPPAPTSNASLADLTVSQSFTNDAATLSGTWDLGTGTAISGRTKAASLTIRYDAATRGYTVSTDARNRTVTPADVTRQETGLVEYRTSTPNVDNLTLFTETGPTSQLKYVGMGFWQSNSVNGGRQSVEYSSFSYGLPTTATAVPRTGSAGYAISLFGLVTAPGEEPRSITGDGTFSIDFAQNQFSAQAFTTENLLVSGGGSFGGGLELRTGGAISSSDGTFSGNAVVGSSIGDATGSISGRLFGPEGQEVGASFQATNSAGMAAVGSLVGARNASATAQNMTLTALRSEQRFYTVNQGAIGNLTILNPETFDFGGYSSSMIGGRFTINDKVTSADANFTSYEKTGNNGYGDARVRIDLYKPGAANTELALTYASFGHWQGLSGAVLESDSFFTYGFVTGDDMLSARTGSARYEGVAYGVGVNSNASARYDIKGTSSIDVDFSALTFGGALVLTGTESKSGARADFGSFVLGGNLFLFQSSLLGNVSRGGNQVGNVWAQFFGPNGQELAGTFYLNAPAGTGEAREVGIQGAFVTTGR